jgi:hypothetical protein
MQSLKQVVILNSSKDGAFLGSTERQLLPRMMMMGRLQVNVLEVISS